MGDADGDGLLPLGDDDWAEERISCVRFLGVAEFPEDDPVGDMVEDEVVGEMAKILGEATREIWTGTAIGWAVWPAFEICHINLPRN